MLLPFVLSRSAARLNFPHNVKCVGGPSTSMIPDLMSTSAAFPASTPPTRQDLVTLSSLTYSPSTAIHVTFNAAFWGGGIVHSTDGFVVQSGFTTGLYYCTVAGQKLKDCKGSASTPCPMSLVRRARAATSPQASRQMNSLLALMLHCVTVLSFSCSLSPRFGLRPTFLCRQQ